MFGTFARRLKNAAKRLGLTQFGVRLRCVNRPRKDPLRRPRILLLVFNQFPFRPHFRALFTPIAPAIVPCLHP